jgi:hypothetical protein
LALEKAISKKRLIVARPKAQPCYWDHGQDKLW